MLSLRRLLLFFLDKGDLKGTTANCIGASIAPASIAFLECDSDSHICCRLQR